MLKKKNFISLIESFNGFSNPNIKLEQYTTDSISTADLIYFVGFDNNDLVGNIIIDLGAGTGRIGLAALIFGALGLICVEKDENALKILMKNAEIYDLQEKIIIFQEDIKNLFSNEYHRNKFHKQLSDRLMQFSKKTDFKFDSSNSKDMSSDRNSTKIAKICIMNPPFGVHIKQIDRYFLRLAMEISDRIYSIHLSNKKNREFIMKYVNKFGWKVQSIHSQKLSIKNTYAFHKTPQKQILTDVYKIYPVRNE